MNTEELRIYLRTVADTTGVQKTQQALRTTQTQAATFGRSSVVGLGLMAGAAATAATATTGLVSTLDESIDVLRQHERVGRATAAAYGSLTGEWQRFAGALSEQTGFTSDAILEAALSARTLSQNYKLTTQQTQQLIRASADLARVRGIGIAEAFERVQSAIRGEAEAAEYLGLTLNDTFVKNNALNGSVKNTFETMTDAQKAQVRYNELLRQTAQFSGLAAAGMNSLDGAFAKAERSGNALQITLGKIVAPSVMAGMTAWAGVLDAAHLKLKDLSKTADDFVKSPFYQWFMYLPGVANVAPSVAAPARDEERLKILAEQEKKLRRLRELNELPSRAAAEDMARLAMWDQVDAAVRDARAVQQEMVDLQRKSVNLAAEEARIRLDMLPAQQEMAERQRQMTEQQIRARQVALPAAEALEDLRFAQQRAQLIGQNRNIDVEQRIAARRELRALGRALPGAELAALEAGRGETLVGRQATRLGMEQQLFQISGQRQLQQIELAQTQTGLLAQIAAQQTQAIELTINLGTEEFQTEVFKQLIEAEKQAQGPTVVKLSGVRR